ncbi:hypothetical protein D5085_15440 [Ectothiorhodospiraceae bacterium BW-2]|nr:hypothetical protein D5085_15440 [Ectothiorhodospiraceae bacterium BW-2]
MQQLTLFFALILTTLLLQPATAETLYISRVSSNIQKTVAKMQPIADYVIANRPELGFTQAKVVVAEDTAQLLQLAQKGELHWVSESAYTAALLVEANVMVPLLNRHKGGVKNYGSVLVAHKRYTSLEQLVGAKVATEDSGSFSGFFLLYRELMERGLPLKLLSSPREDAEADSINLVHSDDEENSLSWLQLDLVQAALFSDSDYHNRQFMSRDWVDKTRPLFQSKQYPRSIELFSTQLSSGQRELLVKSLLALAEEEPEGKLMRSYDKTSGFNRLTERDLEQINSIIAFIKSYPSIEKLSYPN